MRSKVVFIIEFNALKWGQFEIGVLLLVKRLLGVGEKLVIILMIGRVGLALDKASDG